MGGIFYGILAEGCPVDFFVGGLSAVLQYIGGLFFTGRLLEMGWSDAGYIAGGEGIPAGGCGG